MTAAPVPWHDLNQAGLMAHVARLRGRLEGTGPGDDEYDLPEAPALDSLVSAFGLSPFERDTLLLCAAVELDAGFAVRCGTSQGDAHCAYPTFSLALAALPGAHWSAITPGAPLRHWRLVELGGSDTVTRSPLRIDERVLHYLTGLAYLDPRLQGVIQPVPTALPVTESQRNAARQIADRWSRDEAAGWPVIQVVALDPSDAVSVAALACELTGIRLHRALASDLPASADRWTLARLWDREAVLSRSALALECDDTEGRRAASVFVDSLAGPVIVVTREPIPLRTRDSIHLDLALPPPTEQKALWQEMLGSATAQLNGELDRLIAHFRMGARAIQAAGAQARATGVVDGPSLWHACRVQARARLEGLAHRIDPRAGWDDLVLPEPQLRMLRDMASQVRHRGLVYEAWGFGGSGTHGLGISALFAGASGTGKTLAAEVLAHDLGLDLYRIDLSQVVSKYIGETEKNLQRVFDAAEQGGAVLLFDEADALFGRRSEVRDSHDRYANIEISYLLQRMEAYRGLALLTTNLKSLLDSAFLRRIRFIVQFPFPEAHHRAAIWRRMFPPLAPTEGLDLTKLSALNVAGGHIRNIALGAAFLAAEAGEPVRMGHMLRATRAEYAKLEKTLTEAEIKGWT
jgi:hypothetical protein